MDKLLLKNAAISTTDLHIIINHWKPENKMHVLTLSDSDETPDWENIENHPPRTMKPTEIINPPSPSPPPQPPNTPKDKKSTSDTSRLMVYCSTAILWLHVLTLKRETNSHPF